jgi:hypothetical protein
LSDFKKAAFGRLFYCDLLPVNKVKTTLTLKVIFVVSKSKPMSGKLIFLGLFAISIFCSAQQQQGILDSTLHEIFRSQQSIRYSWKSLAEISTPQSEKLRQLTKEMHTQDSLNMVKVGKILDSFGWPDSTVIDKLSDRTIYLVIQSADLKSQIKYEPLLKKAFKSKRIQAQSYAIFQDRFLLNQGKKQKYGSQIGTDVTSATTKYYVRPLTDPKNVDKRRKKMDLKPTMSEYVARYHINWDAGEYVRNYHKVEEMEKALKAQKIYR